MMGTGALITPRSRVRVPPAPPTHSAGSDDRSRRDSSRLWCHVTADVLHCPVWAEDESLDVQDASIGEPNRVACDSMSLAVVACPPPGSSDDAAL